MCEHVCIVFETLKNIEFREFLNITRKCTIRNLLISIAVEIKTMVQSISISSMIGEILPRRLIIGEPKLSFVYWNFTWMS